MKAVLACLFIVLPALAGAEPGYFRVVDVAADDTLNVRETASASSADIGDLPFDARGIEVIETDASGKWGRIVWQEGNGWIAMRFLAPDPVAQVSGTALPVGLLCTGSEPFWSIQLSHSSAVFTDPGADTNLMSLQGSRVAQGKRNFPLQLGYSGSTASANALIRPASCSDGMSDRTYPWGVDLLISVGGSGRYLVGCCHLPLEVGFH